VKYFCCAWAAVMKQARARQRHAGMSRFMLGFLPVELGRDAGGSIRTEPL
jgi:hypothetical protein